MLDVIGPIIKESMSAEEAQEDYAFKVLNQDNLPITVRGEPYVKTYNLEPQISKLKPNGVTPRKHVNNLDYSKANGFIGNNNIGESRRNKYPVSNVNHTNSASKFKIEDVKNHLDEKFTKALDAKLKKLQKEEKSAKKAAQDLIKKPFVTVVKKGKFLEPPPEIANLIGLRIEEPVVKKEDTKKLYAYFSKPRVLNRNPPKNVHQTKCEAAAKAARVSSSVKPNDEDGQEMLFNKNFRDVPLPYSNLMFEKRVFRGSNFAPQSCEHMGDGESAAARAAEARRRAIARRKAKSQQIRAAQLRLGSPPPVYGRKHEKVQTELYLEELLVNPPVLDICTQTDLFLERPVSPFYVPMKTGEDAETQIYPGELFDFDMEVQPILEVLVGKTIEQSLIEVLEEEELAALREQQRKFLELRAAETSEAQRIEERERRLLKEKERRLHDFEEGVNIQKEMEEKIAGAVLTQGYLANLLPAVLEGLESEGFLTDNIKQDVDESFMPWLMKEVTSEVQDMVSSRDLLTDLVKEILENRAEIYKALNEERTPDEEEEEGPTQEDLLLQEHLKLKEDFEKEQAENTQH